MSETIESSSAKRQKTSHNCDSHELPSDLAQVPHNQPVDERSRKCPYLDTINRNLLDFDFEKLCSVSLSKINVYACLVCGKYFQGRGIKTHAYTHSVSVDHHVFLNLETLKFYCLPDNYEIIDSSLGEYYYLSVCLVVYFKNLNAYKSFSTVPTNLLCLSRRHNLRVEADFYAGRDPSTGN